jgi:hypothetical protein
MPAQLGECAVLATRIKPLGNKLDSRLESRRWPFYSARVQAKQKIAIEGTE